MKLTHFWSNKSRRVITPPLAKTNSGHVAGFHLTTDRGPVNVFLGIPYAEPPVGDLRFKKTVPVKPWKEIKKCVRYRSRAPQKDFFWDRLELRVGKNEDCLSLNIIAPSWQPKNDTNGFPVMFYVHGGGYSVDSAVKYRYNDIARLLVVQDVIVVTIQYRLGYLGFFCTGDENCKGNFGLWDQVEALKWVHENIANFGGDPNRITVAGQSAGATSADLLALSPYSRDFFQQMILMGGSAESGFAICQTKRIVEYCRKHAERLGWSGGSSAELMEFLKKVPASKLADGMIGNQAMFTTATLPLGPVIDGEVLPRSLDELRAESRVKKTIIGVCESEGLLFVALGRMKCNKKDIDFGVKLLSDVVKGTGVDADAVVKDVYLKSDLQQMPRSVVSHTFVDMLDDVVSNFGCNLYAEKITSRGEAVYMYSVEHCNPSSFGLLGFFMPFRAATHGTELLYVFNTNIFVAPFRKTEKDRKVTKTMTTLWMNFVKHGDPNMSSSASEDGVLDFKWEPFGPGDDDNYLRIAASCELKKNFKDGRLKTLRKIFGNSRIVM